MFRITKKPPSETGVKKPRYLSPFFRVRGDRVQKHTLSSVKTGLSPDKSELQTLVRKYPPFSGQNVLGFAIVLTLIMKIQSHRKTVTKNAFFYTVCHKNEKRGKIRLFFTPFVRYSAAEFSLMPVIVIASGVCRLFTNDYFCRLV